MLTHMGMRVLESSLCDDHPRMQVSPRLAALMPAEWVSDTNHWMREFFGTESIAIVIHGNTLVMGPKAIRALKEKTNDRR